MATALLVGYATVRTNSLFRMMARLTLISWINLQLQSPAPIMQLATHLIAHMYVMSHTAPIIVHGYKI